MTTVTIALTSSRNAASFIVNGTAVNRSSGRGLNVIVLDQESGHILLTQTYDTSSVAEQSEEFARMIEDLPVGRIVALAVQDDASGKLSARARLACQTLGSALISNLGSHHAWGMIGQKGAPAGAVLEKLDETNQVQLEITHPLASPEQRASRVRLYSAGSSVGNDVWIEVNGQRLVFEGFPPFFGRGLNVAFFDAFSCQLRSQHNFDVRGDPYAAQMFIDLVNGLPEGAYVAVAVKGEAPFQKSIVEQMYQTFESLGSRLIREQRPFDSYVLFGRKQADPGSSAELLSSTRPVFCESWIFPQEHRWQDICITTECAMPEWEMACRSFVDGVEVGALPTGTSGLLVTVIDEKTGIRLQSTAFDPEHHTDASTSLAQLIHSLPMGRVVAISATPGATSFLQPLALQACTLVGGAQVFQAHLSKHACWCLIGRKGSAPGSVAECLGICGITLQFRFTPTTMSSRPYADLHLVSAGNEKGNMASIRLNGYEIAQWERGMNVAVFDEQYGELLQTASYDTNDSASAANEFAALLEGLPTGRIVAIAVKDDASQNLHERARKACESLGSAEIRHLSWRQSWVIVGIKGAAIGSVAEVIGSRSQTSHLRFQLFTKAALERSGVTVRCYSAGKEFGNAAWITVNGRRVERDYTRGLNVVIIDPQNGEVTQSKTFDTHETRTEADAFAAFIEQLPFGMIVGIAVMDAATNNLNERARLACRSIGSEFIDQLEHRQSWAIVGIKGVGPGSVSEMFNASGATEVQAWFPLPPPKKLLFALPAIGAAALFFAIFAVASAIAVLPFIGKNEIAPDQSEPLPILDIQKPPSTQRKAVFVAIDYTQFPLAPSGLGLGDLASQNVEKTRRAMVNTGTLAARNITYLSEAASNPALKPSYDNVKAALQNLVRNAGDGDLLYFHFLGHGNNDTRKSPAEHWLITLTDDMKNRAPFYGSEIQAILRPVSPKVHLTLVLHCCFAAGIIDKSAQGRGIALCAVDKATPAGLDTGNNISNIIATRLSLAYNRSNYGTTTGHLPTYQELLQYIEVLDRYNKPVLMANPRLYPVDKLLFLQPVPLSFAGLVYLQGVGDKAFGSNEFVGTRGESRMLEGFRIAFSPALPGLSFQYMIDSPGASNTSWEDEGTFIGTRTSRGESSPIRAFAIKLTGPLRKLYTVEYMAHFSNVGDTAWVADGAFCGTPGWNHRLEGLQIIVKIRP